MRIWAIKLVLIAIIVGLPLQAWADDEGWQDIYPGIKLLGQTQKGPVQTWAVAVDLCAEGVTVRATTEEDARQTTSSFGRNIGAHVAINGGFYEPDFSPTGFAMGDGQVWSDDITAHGFIGFGSEGASIWAPRMRIEEVPSGLSEAVGGYDSVVVDGEIPDFHQRFCRQRHPRTAVGLSRNGETLYLVVVDGRTDDSRGMTCEELGQAMIDLGAWQGLNLDGGGSTTLWTESQGVLNRPSAGIERVVSNHLAVIATGSGEPSACPREYLGAELPTPPSPDEIISLEVQSDEVVVEDVEVDSERSGQGRGCSGGGWLAGWLASLALFARFARVVCSLCSRC